MIVIGAPLRTVVDDALTPRPTVTVYVPPVTDKVVVGFAPELPARVNLTVVEVPPEYRYLTDALDGDAIDEAIA